MLWVLRSFALKPACEHSYLIGDTVALVVMNIVSAVKEYHFGTVCGTGSA